MVSSSTSILLTANILYVPTLQCNLYQLEILHELKVAFANLAEKEFNFIEDFVEVGWFEYFNLEQEMDLDSW